MTPAEAEAILVRYAVFAPDFYLPVGDVTWQVVVYTSIPPDQCEALRQEGLQQDTNYDHRSYWEYRWTAPIANPQAISPFLKQYTSPNAPDMFTTPYRTQFAPVTEQPLVYNREVEDTYREAFFVAAIAHGARYFLIEWRDPTNTVKAVINLKGYVSEEKAVKALEALDSKPLRHTMGYITHRLAMSHKDAREGTFLDADYGHRVLPLPWEPTQRSEGGSAPL